MMKYSWLIPVARLDAEVVPLIAATLEADAGHGGEGVEATLDDLQLAGGCQSTQINTHISVITINSNQLN